MEQLCDLYFEFSNEDRLDILKIVRTRPLNVTNLARERDITSQECSRHVSRLLEAGLVYKDLDGLYHSSAYGELLLRLQPSYEFVCGHREYFSSHSLDFLPESLAIRIGELSQSDYVGDVMVSIHKMERLLKEAEEYVLTIAAQYPTSTYPLFFDAWERGVRVMSVDPRRRVPPKEIVEAISQKDWRERIHEARAKGLSKDRLWDVIDINLWMSEREVAIIAFPKVDGSSDLLGFSSEDERTRKWCSNLFDYYWEKGEPGHWDEIHLYSGDTP
jgi:predicted transcriptional regulator